MGIVLIALVLAFIAGIIASLVATVVYNEYGDWRAQRRWNSVVDDWSVHHDIVDGECMTCGWTEFDIMDEDYDYPTPPVRPWVDPLAAPLAATNVAMVATTEGDDLIGGNDPHEWDDDELEVIRECGF